MKLMTLAASAAVAGGLIFGGTGVAAAQPGHGRGNDDCPPRCGGADFNRGGPDFDRGNWNRNQWRPDPGQRWDDRWGAPPWGWGPPPPVYWNGGYRPQQIDYWGYRTTPVWNDGFGQWGIWLFGLWIPVFGVGFS